MSDDGDDDDDDDDDDDEINDDNNDVDDGCFHIKKAVCVCVYVLPELKQDESYERPSGKDADVGDALVQVQNLA